MEKKDGLENAAYSEEYLKRCAELDGLFSEEYQKDEKELFLSAKYILRVVTYSGSVSNYNLSGSMNYLLTKTRDLLHCWKSYDDDATFCSLITHQNGHEYLLYRQDLYGYSVYNIDDKEEFRYYPQCAVDGKESFIWTAVYYNEINNFLAVYGCFWACPWSTLLVDFTNPMDISIFQSDVSDHIEGEYDDVDFVRWNGENLVIELTGSPSSKETWVLATEYEKWVKKV